MTLLGLAREVKSMLVAQLRATKYPTPENVAEANRRQAIVRELCEKILATETQLM